MIFRGFNTCSSLTINFSMKSIALSVKDIVYCIRLISEQDTRQSKTKGLLQNECWQD